MASVWIKTRITGAGAKRYRVEFRLGGRESDVQYAGSFKTQREARVLKHWIAGELAGLRVPDLDRLTREPVHKATLTTAAARCSASRVDVAEGTRETYRVATNRLRSRLGDAAIEDIDAQTVARLVAKLHEAGLRKHTIRKTVSVLAMILDYEGVRNNPARDRLTVKMPR